jgi:hypothetical protein
MPGPIGGEALGIPGPKQRLRCRQRSLASHDIEHGLRRALSDHHDPVDLANLDVGGRSRSGSRMTAFAAVLIGSWQTEYFLSNEIQNHVRAHWR